MYEQCCPCYLTTLLSCRANVNSHSTRQTSNLDFNVPKHGIEKFKESFSYQAPSLWNNLPISIRNAISIQSFKSSLKMYLCLHLVIILSTIIICSMLYVHLV